MVEIKKDDIVYDTNGCKYRVHLVDNGCYYCYPYTIVYETYYPDMCEVENEILGENLTLLKYVYKKAPTQSVDEKLKFLKEKIKNLNSEIFEKEKEIKSLSYKYESEKKSIEDNLGKFKESYEFISKIESGKVKYVVDNLGIIREVSTGFYDDENCVTLNCRFEKGKYQWYLRSNSYFVKDFFETYEDAKNEAIKRINKIIEDKLNKGNFDGSYHIYCDNMREIGMQIPKEFIENNVKYWENKILYHKNEIKAYKEKIKKEKGE